MEANELYAEIEKRLLEIRRLVQENSEVINPEHKFALFFNYMSWNEKYKNYRQIRSMFGLSDTVIASASIQMTDSPLFAELMLRAINNAFKTAVENPEIAQEARDINKGE